MILGDSLLCRNVAEYATLLFVVASHVYKDDSNSLCVTAEFAFFRNLLNPFPVEYLAPANQTLLEFVTRESR